MADHAAHAAADLQADLRQLGRFPGAGLAGDDDNLVRRDRGGQVVDPVGHRKLRRVAELRHGRAATIDPGLRRVHLPADVGERALPFAGIADPPNAAQPTPQATLVCRRQFRQTRREGRWHSGGGHLAVKNRCAPHRSR